MSLILDTLYFFKPFFGRLLCPTSVFKNTVDRNTIPLKGMSEERGIMGKN